MTEKELMIGDWVQDVKNLVFKIDTHWTLYNAEFFDPIYLTPEILEKIGFKDGFLLVDEIDIKYSIGNGTLFVMNKGEVLLDMSGIRYVHELQHALRLCKIDKEIKL